VRAAASRWPVLDGVRAVDLRCQHWAVSEEGGASARRPELRLSRWGRVALWDFERGSLAYDMVCLLLALFLLFVQPAWLGDPMTLLP
jgi:hypothetical protein